MALAAGVQKARRVASTVLLVVAFHAVAVAKDVPINKLPEVTAFTIKLSNVPSISASLPWAFRLSRVMVI